jgi:hypothetical protein
MRLVKITLYAGMMDSKDASSVEAIAEEQAELLRGNDDIVTVATDYDERDVPLDTGADDLVERIIDALNDTFPPLKPVLPVPGVRVLGQNGTHKKARLEAKNGRIDLWLGTPKERYPLVTFPMPRLIVGEPE